jgi:hypothetical protein
VSHVYRIPWKDFAGVVAKTMIAKLKAHQDYANP